MEGVGARLGRSSTRYGPATVFNGPVRKWKKRWVHVSPSSSNHHHNLNNSNHSLTHNNHTTTNGTSSSTGNNVNTNNNGHLLLYKWTPLTPSNSNNAASSSSAPSNGNNNASLPNGDEPPRRKFKYVPVDLLAKQKKEAEEQEAAEKVDDESKLSDGDPNPAEQTPKSDVDEKPDINDVPMEENQDDNKVVRQDLNESTLDLSLGLVS